MTNWFCLLRGFWRLVSVHVWFEQSPCDGLLSDHAESMTSWHSVAPRHRFWIWRTPYSLFPRVQSSEWRVKWALLLIIVCDRLGRSHHWVPDPDGFHLVYEWPLKVISNPEKMPTNYRGQCNNGEQYPRMEKLHRAEIPRAQDLVS